MGHGKRAVRFLPAPAGGVFLVAAGLVCPEPEGMEQAQEKNVVR